MADILKPELVWIEGRCYRVNDPSTEVSSLQEHDFYDNDMNYIDEMSAEDDDDFEVTMVDSSRYETTFHVSKHYIGNIMGKKGATKTRIEKETKTNIKIPKQHETGDICILGPTAASVKAARRRINIIVITSRSKQRLTHFISLPMNIPDIMSKFELFKDQVLKEACGAGVEESIFVPAEKLHLTVGIMCLMDNEERLVASKLLAEAKEKVILPLLQQHSPLRIRLKGLSYMNDDPKQIDVLYTTVFEEDEKDRGVLQTLADQLVDHYYNAGYMNRSQDHVKLHVTLLNTRKRESSGDDGRKARVSFDGSEILQKFADIDFGVVELTELHLSQIGTSGDDGYYQPTCVISCRWPQ